MAAGREPRERDWFTLLSAIKLQPDTSHRFLVRNAAESAVESNNVGSVATHLRLDIRPDGGIARFRALGTLTAQAHAALLRRWERTG